MVESKPKTVIKRNQQHTVSEVKKICSTTCICFCSKLGLTGADKWCADDDNDSKVLLEQLQNKSDCDYGRVEFDAADIMETGVAFLNEKPISEKKCEGRTST